MLYQNAEMTLYVSGRQLDNPPILFSDSYFFSIMRLYLLLCEKNKQIL